MKLKLIIRNLVKTTNFWQDNAVILREFRYFRWIAIVAITCTVIGAFLEGSTVGLIASFLQGLTNPHEPPIQTGIEWFDIWFLATTADAEERIYRLSAFILVAIWLRSILKYLGLYYSRLSQSNLCDRIRQRLFVQFQSLSLSYYSNTRSGDLINSITTEINQLKQAVNVFSRLITNVSSLFAYVVSMFWLSWQLSVAAVMLYTLLSVGLSNLIARVREASFAVPKANGKLASIGIEFINGIRTVKASATEEFERQRFKQASLGIIEAEDKVASLSTLVQPLAEGVASTILIVMVILALNLFIINGNMQAASLLTFMFVLFRMMPLVSQMNGARENLGRFRGSLEHIQELLRRDNKTYLKDGNQQFLGLKRSIDFISVDFGYNPSELVLRNITLSIEKGKTTALVGASGAGKTTLADLIPRFYDPTRGQVLIDGVDVRELEIKSLLEKMSVVSQDTFIFNNTIRYNIAYGLKDVDELEIVKVAKQANVWEFLEEMPEGLDTTLGDRGVRLSGGQRQRIAIARAILRNPEILILDEATSALDSVTERLIQESLERLAKGRTVIAIAHRLSTIAKADKIVVLEQGKIIEQGSYQDLLARKAALWKYHQMQYELSTAEAT